MIVYYRNQRVVLVSEDETTRTIRLGGGEEIKLPREEVLDSPPSPGTKETSPEPTVEENKHTIPRVNIQELREEGSGSV